MLSSICPDVGLLLSEGTIVDAMMVPSSAKNRDRDPEMGSTKKETSWYFGLKAHVGSGPQGRVHSAVATSASVYDSEIMEDCVHGAEEVIYGGKAYVRAERSTAGNPMRWSSVSCASRTAAAN